jgi:broad specificity phosphatase PhoE
MHKGELLMKTRLILIKHAKTSTNERDVFSCGNYSDLNQDGFDEAEHIVERIEDKIDLLYSSTDLKCVNTARAIAKAKSIELMVSDDLDDVYGGQWEAKRWDEISQKWPNEYQTWINEPYKLTFPGGESLEQFKNRLIMKLRKLVNENPGRTICAVVCNHPLNLLFSYFEGLDFKKISLGRKFGNGSVHIVDIENGVFKKVT